MQKEKIILIGASDGIGRAIAIEFAKQGHTLALLSRRLEMLEAVKAECLKAGSPKVLVAAVDVADEVFFEATLNRIDDEIGGATVFIANAGVMGRSTNNDDSWARVKFTLTVNVMAAIHGLEVMKLKMLKRGHGILCGVSSIAGARGMPTGGAYSTSKAALTTHLEGMRLDLKPYGLSVVTIAPGFIRTPMTSHNHGTMPFLMDADQAAKIFCRGILAKKRFVVAPRPYRIIYPILQMLPRPIFDFLMSRAYRMIRG
jgi:short-subunit dehydrogenase